jgi:phytoene dehydrogenase-like protein
LVVEGTDEIGGGTRTAELTLPGFRHDVCSAAHPFAVASPFLASLPLDRHGLEWITPPAAVAHPLDGRAAVMLEQSVAATAAQLGPDRTTYQRHIGRLVADFSTIVEGVLGPLLRLPRHPIRMARFGLPALMSATRYAQRFEATEARALMAGLAAHAIVPLNKPATNGVALSLGVAGHISGWPIARGGSAALTSAMAGYLATLGGEIRTGEWVTSLTQLPPSDAVLLDVTPAQLATIAGSALSDRRRRSLRRWKYGPAAFKLDLAVSDPIPWADPAVAGSATVHVGGTFEQIAAAEAAVWRGSAVDEPFVLLTQPSLFDGSRAPEGQHTVWAYCHVPAGWTGDASESILAQIERFAPGFRDTILGSSAMGPLDYERYNPNNVGGAIGGGALTLRQLVARPRLHPDPYATTIDDTYLCSAATPPGAGTHGMCGFHAARSALRRTFGR